MKKIILPIAALFLSLSILSGCANKQAVEGGGLVSEASRSKQIEPEVRPLYYQAERAFAAKNYDLAQKLFGQVKTKYPHSRATAFAAYRLGIIHYYKENYEAATRDFEYHLGKVPDSEFTFDATYNWAASEYQQNHFEKAYQVLARFKASDVQAQGPRRAEIVYALTARIATALNNPQELLQRQHFRSSCLRKNRRETSSFNGLTSI